MSAPRDVVPGEGAPGRELVSRGVDVDAGAQDDLLERLFAAIAACDVDSVAELYADDVEVWHNASGRALDREGGLAVLRAFVKRTEAIRYEVLERRHWEGGAVQRHVLHMRIAGAEHTLDACILFAFAGGRITRVFEYVDGKALAPLGW
jgi:ketosteroid isomerase-like protein